MEDTCGCGVRKGLIILIFTNLCTYTNIIIKKNIVHVLGVLKKCLFVRRPPPIDIKYSIKDSVVNSLTRDRFHSGFNPCFSKTRKLLKYLQVLSVKILRISL